MSQFEVPEPIINTPFEEPAWHWNIVEGETAEKDDSLVIDFVGRVDGREFPGGKAEEFNLVLGSGQLVPGFEDQLLGAKSGDERDVSITFPPDYPEPKLAGQPAVFAVTVRSVSKPDPIAVDDALATKVGVGSLSALRERVRDQMKQDFSRASRMHSKRRILDALDEAHSLPLPPAMVELLPAKLLTRCTLTKDFPCCHRSGTEGDAVCS